MTAIELLHIINKGNKLEEKDFQSLVEVHCEFPYFVLPTILAAKYQQNHFPTTDQEFLPLAAFQSPDRKRLKFFMENPIPFIPFLPEEQSSVTNSIEVSDELETRDLSSTYYQGEIISFEEENKPEPTTELQDNEGQEGNTEQKEISDASLNAKSPVKKRRRDVLKELEENLNRLKSTGQKEPIETTFSEVSPPQDNNLTPSPELAPDALLAAIKNRKEKNILNEKKHLQDHLIDEFNKKTIKFNNKPLSDEVDESIDLSIESTQLKEQLVSESFARILVKQKKISEAREIYQKLQLKFPDKKAYFADCLEKLENN